MCNFFLTWGPMGCIFNGFYTISPYKTYETRSARLTGGPCRFYYERNTIFMTFTEIRVYGIKR